MAKQKIPGIALIIGGFIGLTIHFFLGHGGDFGDYYTIGLHNLNGIAHFFAGAFVALLIFGKRQKKKNSLRLIIGGIAGFIVHVFLAHMGDVLSVFTFGFHLIEALALILAGAFIGKLTGVLSK